MKVFLSYRHSDSKEFTNLLYKRLTAKYGENRVFLDVEDTYPGDDLRIVLKNIISNCDVFLCVIGKNWADAKTESGQKRLYLENDIVRMEVETAITLNTRIIPVMVYHESFDTQNTPLSLHPLKDKIWAKFSNPSNFPEDTENLIEAIERKQHWNFEKEKVFISYTQDDIEIAKAIKTELEEFDFEAWLAEEDLQSGKEIDTELQKSIKNSDYFLLLISEASIASNYVNKELEIFNAIDSRTNKAISLINVKLGDLEIPIELENKFEVSKYKYAKMTQDFSKGMEEILVGMNVANPRLFKFRRGKRFRKKFFEPRARIPTVYAYNQIFFTPNVLLGKDGNYRPESSTRTFQVWLEDTFQELNKLSGYPLLGTRRLIEEETERAVGNIEKEKLNIITYASSKINPITERALKIFEDQYKKSHRYVFTADLLQGAVKSDLRPAYFNQSKGNDFQVSLYWNEKPFIRDVERGIDYGLIIRGRPFPEKNDQKMWWILSGCGRPAMFAVQELFINPEGVKILENALLQKDSNWPSFDYIAIALKVNYRPKFPFSSVSVYEAQTLDEADWILNRSDEKGKLLEIEIISIIMENYRE